MKSCTWHPFIAIETRDTIFCGKTDHLDPGHRNLYSIPFTHICALISKLRYTNVEDPLSDIMYGCARRGFFLILFLS